MIKFTKVIRPDLTLILGETATDLFLHLGVQDLHGLNLKECKERINLGGSYIDGMCNEYPCEDKNQKKLYYLFLNESAWTELKVENFGLIFHEATHYFFRKYWNDLQNREEQLITEAEVLAIDIYKLIF